MKKMNLFLLIIGVVALVGSANVNAATIVINNNDGPGEGFNDPTPVAPVGGNPGVTLGQQRLNAFTYAANIWAQCLFSNVTIEVDAQMNPLFCNAGGAVLGSAGATTVHRDYTGAPKAATWYCQALANSLHGADLAPGTADLSAQFNSDIDNNNACLNGINWYYGLDANPPGADIDFVTVVLHEIGHGIGFQTFQNSAGVWLGGFPDAYGCLMYHDGNAPPDYPSMSNAQRGACNIGDPELVWDGACAITFGGNIPLTSGVLNGRPRLHGPNPYQGGSSLSHWSSALFPNQLMEPFYAGPDHTMDLDLQLLKDTGWILDKTVATAVSSFVVRNGKGGVEIMAEFSSDVDDVSVDVYRGDKGTTPVVTVGSADVRANEPFRFVDNGVEPGKSYAYRIGVRDEDGLVMSPIANITIPVVAIELGQNKPNPFNPTTVISFTLPAEQHVRLSIYDANGTLIRSLVNESRSFGKNDVTWDGRDNAGALVSSGVYFYRLSAGHVQPDPQDGIAEVDFRAVPLRAVGKGVTTLGGPFSSCRARRCNRGIRGACGLFRPE